MQRDVVVLSFEDVQGSQYHSDFFDLSLVFEKVLPLLFRSHDQHTPVLWTTVCTTFEPAIDTRTGIMTSVHRSHYSSARGGMERLLSWILMAFITSKISRCQMAYAYPFW